MPGTKTIDKTAKKERKRRKAEVTAGGAHAAEEGKKEAKVKVAVKNLTMGVSAGEVSESLNNSSSSLSHLC